MKPTKLTKSLNNTLEARVLRPVDFTIHLTNSHIVAGEFMIIKTIKECEERLQSELDVAFIEQSPMDLWCTEFYCVQNSLKTMEFSESEVEEFTRLSPSEKLKSKVAIIFGENSPITRSFNNVTSGIFPYTKVIEQSYGTEVLRQLEENIKKQCPLKMAEINQMCEQILEIDAENRRKNLKIIH